jgi:hypothetical protein
LAAFNALRRPRAGEGRVSLEWNTPATALSAYLESEYCANNAVF